MANRYWVGGTDTWDATAGSKWATTSGGGGGAATPTNTDDVFFDAASGAVTITSGGASAVCQNFDTTGFTGTYTGQVNIKGNCVLGAASTFSLLQATMSSTTSGKTVTSNGKTFYNINFRGAGGGWTLADTLNCGASSFTISDGTFNTGNFNINTSGQFKTDLFSGTRVINLGSSVLTSTSTAAKAFNFLDTAGGTTTLNAGTSTLKVNGTGTVTFEGGGRTFYNVEINGAATISGANTYNDLKVGAGGTATFTAGVTQTVSSFTSGGTAGNNAVIQSSSAGSAATLSKSSGTVNVNNISIKDSTATGGATWNANFPYTNNGGNTGWNFQVLTSAGNFMAFM